MREYYEEVLGALGSNSQLGKGLRRILDGELSMPNIPMKTMGGHVFWNTIASRGGYRLQQNMLTQHARILDPDDWRIAWGTISGMVRTMDRMVKYMRENMEMNQDSVTFTQCQISEVVDGDPKYAKNYSESGFWDKIKGVLKSAGLEIIYKALQLYYVMQKPECPMYIKTAIVAVLGYFISPLDLIPDAIPVIGFSDDLAAIVAALVMAQAYVDDDVKAQARNTIDSIFGSGTSREIA